jgi:hypothetical protein
MNTLIESLRRLYIDGKVTLVKLDGLLTTAKITQEEYDYILV